MKINDETVYYKVAENVLKATLEYLSVRPYREVAQLMEVLQGSAPIKQEIKKDEKNKK